MFPTKFGVTWPFGSEEVKNNFLRWQPWWPSGFPIRMILAILICESPQRFLSSFKTIRLLFQKKQGKIDFQDSGHLDFPIGTILAIFNLQATPMFPTKFHVNWHFSSEEAKDRL